MKIETHCHSMYSHDSSLKIQDIINECHNKHVDAIVICDHDICGLTKDDEILFTLAGITVLKAIEFTTMEGIHVIGCGSDIKEVECKPKSYSAIQTVNRVKKIGAFIIIPHPYHETGLIGNGSISLYEQDYILSRADFVEIDNYRYGPSNNIKQFAKYKELRYLIGSDAHSKNDIGTYCNIINCLDTEYDLLRKGEIVDYVREKKRTTFYWKWRKIKRGRIYQYLITHTSSELRKKIKNKFINK